MLLVLTVVGAGVSYDTHLGGHLRGVPQADGGGQLAAELVDPQAPGAEIASGPVADGARDCSDDHAPSARCAPLPPAFSPGPAALPGPSVGRLVSVAVHDDVAAPDGTAEATAPSLHALGISRT